MPTTVTSTSEYVGKVAGGIVGKTFKEADTLAKGLITVHENVNYQEHLRRIRYTDGTTAYSCGFTPSGATILNERTLTPIKLKNDFQICKETFRNQWGDGMMGSSAWNESLIGNEFMAAIMTEVLSETAVKTDSKIWTGNDSNADEWDGFLTLFAADAAIIKDGNGLTAPGAATTSANVFDHLALTVAAIPVALRRKPDLKLIVSPDVADAYMHKLIANGNANGLGGNANTQLVYGRYALEVVNALPDNTIVVFQKQNLVFGTGLLGDHNYFKLVDEDEIGLLTGFVRGKMVYNGGVNYYNSEDIVWMTTTA
jgi:hypothetical protein